MKMESDLRHNYAAKKLCVAISAVCWWSLAEAAPQGGKVSSGTANIATHGNVTQIDQTTAKAAINWQGFNVGLGETVDFKQPNAAAITLNRVVGNERSVIDGTVRANGQVFLINSNGVVFSKGSSVNTAGLVASTLNISDADFEAGHYTFSGDESSNALINRGTLSASDGGYVALLGQNVSNTGLIVATTGTAALAGGKKISLNFQGNSLLSVSIDEGALAALVKNRGAILADGGKVILTAKAADDLLSAQVNNTGIIQARTLGDLKGNIDIRADGGSAHIGGTVDVSAPPGGDGGHIETRGNRVSIASDAVVDSSSEQGNTGSWLIDADSFNVAAMGADITGAQLGNLLDNNNITVASTQGDVTINTAVSWLASTQLTINAAHDININAPIAASGNSAGLAINYGSFAKTGSAAADTDYRFKDSRASVTLNGADATLSINGAPYTLIHTMEQLAAISPTSNNADGNPILDVDTGHVDFTAASGNYALAQNLDAAGTTYSHAVVGELSGNFTGLGHSISNLTVAVTTPNQYGEYENAALIDTLGTDTSSTLRDVRLLNVDIASGGTAAGLVATNYGSISDVHVTGMIAGNQSVGGVAGWNLGIIDNARADVLVTAMAGGTDIGGLTGFNGLDGRITNASANGFVLASGVDLADGGLQSSSGIGGLVGLNGGVIDNVNSFVAVITKNSQSVGGLVGQNLNIAGDEFHGVISNATSKGVVDATWTNTQLNGQSYGGLVGENSGGFISKSAADVNVMARATTVDSNGIPWSINNVGGLVGTNASNSGIGGAIADSTSSGTVKGFGAIYYADDIIGRNVDGTVVDVYAEAK